MTPEEWEQRRIELQEALKNALKDLHLHMRSSTFSGVYGPLWLEVRPATEAELAAASTALPG